MVLLNQPPSAKQQPKSDFESLLAPFSAKGNAYWQHQNQLQQSALTFKPAITHAETKVTPDNEPVKESITLPIKIDAAPEVTHIAMQIGKSTPASTTLSKLTIEQLITQIKTTTAKPSPVKNDQTLIQSNNTNKINPKTMPDMMFASTFKQYQLFSDNMQVELTLSITHLSKQQQHELQQFIRQNVSQNGYTLKQLIINGVKQ